MSYGTLTVEASVISDNHSDVEASVPSVFLVDFAEANAGGLYLTPGSTTIIRSSRISGNSVRGSNTAGDIEAEAGGIDSDGSLLLTDSSVEHNTAQRSSPRPRASSRRRTAVGSRYRTSPSCATAASVTTA